MLLNSSSITNYGNYSISSIYQSILDVAPPASAKLSNFGNLVVLASNLSVEVPVFHFGNLDISSGSVLNLGRSASFQNGSSANVNGVMIVSEGVQFSILPYPCFWHFALFFFIFDQKRNRLAWILNRTRYSRSGWDCFICQWLIAWHLYCCYWWFCKSSSHSWLER